VTCAYNSEADIKTWQRGWLSMIRPEKNTSNLQKTFGNIQAVWQMVNKTAVSVQSGSVTLI